MQRIRVCFSEGCDAQATERCFECGAWHCVEHLAVIQVPTFEGSLRELLCGECLQAHVQIRDRFGPFVFEVPQSGVSVQGA
jgi:hypothetical protein